MIQRCTTVVLAVSLLLCAVGAASAAYYGVIDATPGWNCLGLNPDGALGVNATGQAGGVGYAPGGSIARPFFWNGTAVTDLGLGPFSNQTRGMAINNAGTVVGYGLLPMQAWYCPAGGAMTTLPYLTSGTSSQALAINTAGEVGGYSNGPGVTHAVVWSKSTGSYAAYDLAAAGGSTWINNGNSRITAVNNAGRAAGASTYSSDINPPTDHAFYSTYSIVGGVLTNTNTEIHNSVLGQGNAGVSKITAINDHDQMVGTYGPLSGSRAFLYTIGGAKVDLPFVGSGTQSYGYGISNNGLAVGWGYSDAGNTIPHAFVYNGGTTIDLNSLIDPASGWTLKYAYAISGAFIAGTGTNAAGDTHGFVISLLPGDADLNGTVNTSDLSRLLTNYDKPGDWSMGDFDGTATVNTSDLSKVLTNYDKSASLGGVGSKSVPEPSTLLLAAAGLLGLLGRMARKRK